MNNCINITTRGCVLMGDCKCGINLNTKSYDGYLQSSADGKINFGVSYTLKGLIKENNETH
jgi:hypothetical protein